MVSKEDLEEEFLDSEVKVEVEVEMKKGSETLEAETKADTEETRGSVVSKD